MSKLGKGIFLTLLLISLAVSQESEETNQNEMEQATPEQSQQPAQSQQSRLPMFCKEDLPTLSVYDLILDSTNWDKFKKQNDLFILGASDSDCSACCQSEPLLKELQELFQPGKYTYKGKKIPIVRVDTHKRYEFLQKEDISFESVPKVIIVKDQRFYGFDQVMNRTDLLIHQMNRIINPLVELKTEEEVDKFLDTQDEFWEADYQTNFFKKAKAEIPNVNEYYKELRFKTRVICFLYDKQEYREEFKNLKQDARYLSTRENLRVGFVDNQKVIRKIKAKYSVKMFSSISYSSLVLKRYDGEIKYYDLTGEDHVFIHSWINKNSVKEVEELTNESYKIQELLRQPMFLTFVDFDDPKVAKKCYKALEVIKEIAPKYSHLMGFYYVNNTIFWSRKRVLGVTWDDLPSMAFNMIDTRVMPYPRGKEISKVALFDWFDDLVKGKIQSDTKDFSRVKNDTEIEEIFLNNTIHATRDTFHEIVLTEGFDVVLLIYTTEVINNNQRNIALQYNLVADAFIKLQMTHTMRAVSYDINVNAFPEGIEFTMDLPQIYFFPAYNKKTPYRKYIGQGVAGQILLYCQREAEIQFKYPVDVSRIGLPRDDVNKDQQQAQEQNAREEERQINDEEMNNNYDQQQNEVEDNYNKEDL